jgi:F-type H+-transporting ATPase subunit c
MELTGAEAVRLVSLLGATIVSSVAAIAASTQDAAVASKALESIARQPEVKDSIFTTMLIGMGLVDAVPIIAIVISFILLFAK